MAACFGLITTIFIKRLGAFHMGRERGHRRTIQEVGGVVAEIVKGLLLPFFTALGVIVGGSFIGGLAALFYAESPFHRMQKLAGDVKLWAIVVVIGGTFPTLRALDSGIFGGEFIHLVRQLALIVAGFLGSQTGFWIVMTVTGGRAT